DCEISPYRYRSGKSHLKGANLRSRLITTLEFKMLGFQEAQGARRVHMRNLQQFVTALSILVVPATALGQSLDTSAIEQTLGRAGQKSGEVYKLSFPRTDLQVAVNGVPIKAGLAL